MRRPSPALVISIIALVFAMGGTGWAVTQLPKNSVGTPQLKKSAVTSPKIKDGSIATADLSTAARAALKGEKGDTGPAGPKGAGGSASAYAAGRNLIGITEAGVTVASLGQGTGASGPVTVTERSRLAITATVSLGFASGSNAVATCRPQVRRGAESIALDAPLIVSWQVMDFPGLLAIYTVPVVNSATVEAGTYDVAIECSQIDGSDDVDAADRFLRVDVMPA